MRIWNILSSHTFAVFNESLNYKAEGKKAVTKRYIHAYIHESFLSYKVWKQVKQIDGEDVHMAVNYYRSFRGVGYILFLDLCSGYMGWWKFIVWYVHISMCWLFYITCLFKIKLSLSKELQRAEVGKPLALKGWDFYLVSMAQWIFNSVSGEDQFLSPDALPRVFP